MIKIDVEGHELEVMVGAKELIKKNKPLLIFEHNIEVNKEQALKINDFLEQLDYVIYLIQPNFNLFSNPFSKFIGGMMRFILGEKLIFHKTDKLPHKNFPGFQLILAIPKIRL